MFVQKTQHFPVDSADAVGNIIVGSVTILFAGRQIPQIVHTIMKLDQTLYWYCYGLQLQTILENINNYLAYTINKAVKVVCRNSYEKQSK